MKSVKKKHCNSLFLLHLSGKNKDIELISCWKISYVILSSVCKSSVLTRKTKVWVISVYDVFKHILSHNMSQKKKSHFRKLKVTEVYGLSELSRYFLLMYPEKKRERGAGKAGSSVGPFIPHIPSYCLWKWSRFIVLIIPGSGDFIAKAKSAFCCNSVKVEQEFLQILPLWEFETGSKTWKTTFITNFSSVCFCPCLTSNNHVFPSVLNKDNPPVYRKLRRLSQGSLNCLTSIFSLF